ncbi:MAG: hypothetical protein C0501_07300 [Isosphaera sp.]|nr:hypothetical protein [Isosphaera sp.]
MTGRYGLFAAVAAAALAGPGCVCCGNHGHRAAREVGPDCEVPCCQRNQVYVFAVGGLDPAGLLALGAFRDGLNGHGFEKVGTGQAVHAGWMAKEMRRVRADNPNAVFVLVGVGGGGPAAAKLAAGAVADGLPVAGFVRVGDGKPVDPPAGVRTLALCGPAAAAETVAAVAGLLNEVAANTAAPPPQGPEFWTYPHATPGRPELEPGPDPDWAFLFDRPGGTTPAIAAPAAAPVAPGTVVPVSAGARP